MIHVILTKIKSNHSNLRTNAIEGVTNEMPTAGKNFILIGEGLEFGMRMVRTTPVSEILNMSNGSTEFKTQNSHYKLEVVKEKV